MPGGPARMSGMCTLMLEMFDNTGTRKSCSNNGRTGDFVFVLPNLAGTPADYTSVLGSHNITPDGNLVFQVQVDNNPAYAKLDSVTAGGHAADGCGILHYDGPGALVDIAFHARNPTTT